LSNIIGKANDESGIKFVSINGKPPASVEKNGLFRSQILLNTGENTLNIIATDNNGNKSSKIFKITGTQSQTNKKNEKSVDQPIREGNYHAILLAQNDYKDPSIPSLGKPSIDAQELKTILETNYTFQTTNILLLQNNSREEIIETVTAKCNTLTENDNLLIFYAGHGIANKDKYGNLFPYWIPVSAKKGQVSSYISFNDIKIAIQSSNARHILIISDACFSGGITRKLPSDAPLSVMNLYELNSRRAMTSGNLEVVPDNSVFAANLKEKLKTNKSKYLAANDLFQSFKKIVQNYGTVPLHDPIPETGDNGGDFIFIRKQ
jgi:hypothetical protein